MQQIISYDFNGIMSVLKMLEKMYLLLEWMVYLLTVQQSLNILLQFGCSATPEEQDCVHQIWYKYGGKDHNLFRSTVFNKINFNCKSKFL